MSISLILHVCNFTSLFRRRVFIHALAQATISLQDICFSDRLIKNTTLLILQLVIIDSVQPLNFCV